MALYGTKIGRIQNQGMRYMIPMMHVELMGGFIEWFTENMLTSVI